MIHFHIITLFPESIACYFDASMLKRARQDGKIKVSFYNPRDYTNDLPAPRPGKYFVYVIRCSDDSFYIGQTQNVESRYRLHQQGRGGQHTKKFSPQELIHYEVFDTRADAVDREKKLKTGFGRKWLKREWKAGRTRQAGKHRRVDQRPYGGGPGMVLEAESVLKAAAKAIGRKRDVEVVFFSPGGKQFEQKDAVRIAKKAKHVVFLCGHYEGIDARAVKILNAKPVSVGPYVLTGGELPAALVADAVTRNIKGVLGNAESLEDSRIASPEVYTRPEVLEWKRKKYRVPKVLVSGHHKNIEEWRKKKRT